MLITVSGKPWLIWTPTEIIQSRKAEQDGVNSPASRNANEIELLLFKQFFVTLGNPKTPSGRDTVGELRNFCYQVSQYLTDNYNLVTGCEYQISPSFILEDFQGDARLANSFLLKVERLLKICGWPCQLLLGTMGFYFDFLPFKNVTSTDIDAIVRANIEAFAFEIHVLIVGILSTGKTTFNGYEVGFTNIPEYLEGQVYNRIKELLNPYLLVPGNATDFRVIKKG